MVSAAAPGGPSLTRWVVLLLENGVDANHLAHLYVSDDALPLVMTHYQYLFSVFKYPLCF